MMFSEQQLKDLAAPLSAANVKKNPRGYDYIEGWKAIAEANRIFGFGSWDRHTLEMRQLGEPEQVNGNWRVAYHCRVRIIVRAGDQEIIRDGSGYGSGIGKDIRDVHESAIKEGETDAMKRGLMTFGNAFGLALYDKAKTDVEAELKPEPEKSVSLIEKNGFMVECREAIAQYSDPEKLLTWWNSASQKELRRKYQLDASQVETLKVAVVDRRTVLMKKAA